MANGGESRDIVHGTLATGETVSLHESMQMAEAEPNPLHTIQHSEFILVREGELEFQHESSNGLVSEHVGPGGVFYVAYGTKHTVKNAGGFGKLLCGCHRRRRPVGRGVHAPSRAKDRSAGVRSSA